MATPTICLFNKFGYCKYKEVCRKHHINDICSDSSCDFLTCRLRHPKLCNWYSEYGRCKFQPCAFRHEEKENDIKKILEENSKVMSKLEAVEKSLAELEAKEKETFVNIEKLEQVQKSVEENEKRIKEIEIIFENKFDSLENKINTLTKCLGEKDSIIENLRIKLVTKSQTHLLEIEERFGKIERRAYVLEKTKLGNEFCDFCGEEFDSKSNMNEHIRYTHTFACEICGSSFKTLTDLETHMHTCEKFDCDRCKVTMKTVSDVKKHCQSKHRNGADIYNFKFDRESSRKVIMKHFNSRDL